MAFGKAFTSFVDPTMCNLKLFPRDIQSFKSKKFKTLIGQFSIINLDLVLNRSLT